MNFHFFQSVNFSSSCRNLGLKKRGFFRKKLGFYFVSQKITISEKNCLQNLNLFLEEPASRIFYFSISHFEIWRVTLPLGQYLYAFSSARPVLLSGPSILVLKEYASQHFGAHAMRIPGALNLYDFPVHE